MLLPAGKTAVAPCGSVQGRPIVDADGESFTLGMANSKVKFGCRLIHPLEKVWKVRIQHGAAMSCMQLRWCPEGASEYFENCRKWTQV